MAQEFTMPKLGLTMTDGTIREWLVADGTMVHKGDPVLVIETDKVETEVEARESGILSVTGVVGENYECGAVIGYLLAEGEEAAQGRPAEPAATTVAPSAETASPAPAAATAAAAVTTSAAAAVTTPAMAGAVHADVAARGEGNRILASPRARAAARQLDVELAHIAGTGPSGRILAGDVTDFAERQAAAARTNGAEVAEVAGTQPEPAPPAAAETARAAVPAPSSAPATSGVGATAGARMLAELLGLDLRAVPAETGARLTREDVAAWVRSRLAADPTAAGPPASSATATTGTTPKALPEPLQTPSSVTPMRGMRAVIAQRMHESLQGMAQLTLSVDADMTAIDGERDRRRQAELTVPGYTAFVVAAAARALVDHPYVNSQMTDQGVALLPDVHVGVAVALDDGLIVPVVEHANTRDVEELHAIVADLAGRARESKLKLPELEGGTFSVTALGMYGVDMFTPVINPPNTAILGVGRLRTDTRWSDGVPSPKTVMTLSLTWDHRAFDGAPAAEFAQSVVRYLENPAQLDG